MANMQRFAKSLSVPHRDPTRLARSLELSMALFGVEGGSATPLSDTEIQISANGHMFVLARHDVEDFTIRSFDRGTLTTDRQWDASGEATPARFRTPPGAVNIALEALR